MRWRRGLVLAGIHLAVASAIVASIEVNEGKMLRERQGSSRFVEAPALVPVSAVTVQDVMPDFSVCGTLDEYSPQERLVFGANLPVYVVTQWRSDCPSHWSLPALLGVKKNRFRQADWMAKQREMDEFFLLLIAAQWFFVGGFPLRQGLRLWSEPGMFITLCTLAAAPFALFQPTEAISGLPMMFAFGGWVWWFGLLVWRLLRGSFRTLVRRTMRNAGLA